MEEGEEVKERKVLAWHFIRENRFARDGKMLIEPGIYMTDEKKIVPCESGLHGSEHPLDALKYAPGPVLCRVRMWGEIAEHGNPVDKLVARTREVLWMRDISAELRLFACWCVRETPLHDGRKVWDLLTDPRSRAAVETAERFARGEGATKKELAAAEAVGWAVASAAARDAAGAAAEAAAWATARDAAGAARDAQRAEFARVCAALDAEMSCSPR